MTKHPSAGVGCGATLLISAGETSIRLRLGNEYQEGNMGLCASAGIEFECRSRRRLWLIRRLVAALAEIREAKDASALQLIKKELAEIEFFVEWSQDPVQRDLLCNVNKILNIEAASNGDLGDDFKGSLVADSRGQRGIDCNGFGVVRSLSRIGVDCRKGISLVTCCRDREKYLLQALPSWLALSEIAEFVIVDWSSARPIAKAIDDLGIKDNRIRIVRVEGEARWILSRAYNIGFRVANHSTILKIDADICLSRSFLDKNIPAAGEFFAGNWRNSVQSQKHTNGTFVIEGRALGWVGGFSENITTYGWDDEDLYSRLLRIGYARRDIFINTLHHISHSDAERVGIRGPAFVKDNARQSIKNPQFFISYNKHLSSILRPWDFSSPSDEYRVIYRSGCIVHLQRSSHMQRGVLRHITDLAAERAIKSTSRSLSHTRSS